MFQMMFAAQKYECFRNDVHYFFLIPPKIANPENSLSNFSICIKKYMEFCGLKEISYHPVRLILLRTNSLELVTIAVDWQLVNFQLAIVALD